MLEELSELQRDALTETINIGVGRASRGLSVFAKSDVAISVPIIIQSEPENILSIVSPELFDSPDVSSVSRRVIGLDADVVMIFQASNEALSDLMKTNIVREGQEDPSNLREAAINKIGYLVVESCLDQIENVVGRNIERFKLNYFPKLPKGIFNEKYAPKEAVIIVKIDIGIPKRDIKGYLLCSMTHKAANRLADGLDSLVEDSLG